VFDLPITLQQPVVVDAEAVPSVDIGDATLPAAEKLVRDGGQDTHPVSVALGFPYGTNQLSVHEFFSTQTDADLTEMLLRESYGVGAGTNSAIDVNISASVNRATKRRRGALEPVELLLDL
jgi:hypothetical protein